MIATGRMEKLVSKLPQARRSWIRVFVASQIKAERNRARSLPCDLDLAVIHFDRARGNSPEYKARQGQSEAGLRGRGHHFARGIGYNNVRDAKIDGMIDPTMEALPGEREATERHTSYCRVIDESRSDGSGEPAELNWTLRQAPRCSREQTARYDKKSRAQKKQPMDRFRGMVKCPPRGPDDRMPP